MWHKLLKLLGVKNCPSCKKPTDVKKKTVRAKKQ